MRLDKAIRTLSNQRGNIEEVKALKIALFDAGLVVSNRENEQEESIKAKHSKMHKPKDVADFMKLFNDPDELKFLTHDFDLPDQKFDARSFLFKARNVFSDYTRKYEIPDSLYQVIRNFAFEKSPKWWFNGQTIKQGWSTPEWLAWSEQYGHPLNNSDFATTIQSFREVTRIKSWATPLQKIVKSAVNKKLNFSFKLEYIDLNNADFYTQADYLRKALEEIFEEIRQYPDCPLVSIKYDRQTVDNYRHRIIKICQHGSYSNKPLQEVIEKYRQQKGGQLGTIRKNLFGYCDWHIETIWAGQSARVHFLREPMISNDVEVEIEDLDERELPGFTHTLIFYYR